MIDSHFHLTLFDLISRLGLGIFYYFIFAMKRQRDFNSIISRIFQVEVLECNEFKV